MRVHRSMSHRRGFTLVEILMVVAIIGILVGLLVPAVNRAFIGVKQKAIVLEVQTLANAVEQYKNKYGDFPPDGASRKAWESHFRKAFPQIQSTEFTALYANANASNGLPASITVMDPAEALVFCLGGYSSDVTRPFTGPGGPLSLIPTTTNYQYNTDRRNGFFEFQEARLTIDNSSGAALSTDETTLGLGTVNDLIPTYHPSGKLAPYVYFDSRTYAFIPSGASAIFFNFYQPANIVGVARPYKSGEINTNVAHASSPDAFYRYVSDRSFQIISAGLDDSYGGVPGLPNSGTPQFYRYPSGDSLNITVLPAAQSGPTRYSEGSDPSPQLDNATSFADGILEDGLDN